MVVLLPGVHGGDEQRACVGEPRRVQRAAGMRHDEGPVLVEPVLMQPPREMPSSDPGLADDQHRAPHLREPDRLLAEPHHERAVADQRQPGGGASR